jgi:hypothetical protein
MVRHQAALASGKLTRGTSGVNLPPSEVMMSRQLSRRQTLALIVRRPPIGAREVLEVGHLIWSQGLVGDN